MSARRTAGTALLLLAVAAAPRAATAEDARCPGVTTGGYSAGVCESLTVTPTGNTGYTVQGGVRPYCSVPQTVACQMLAALLAVVNVAPTGADVNGSTPPVPAYDPATGQVSAPAGNYATVWVNGTPYTVDTPAYCVTIDVRC